MDLLQNRSTHRLMAAERVGKDQRKDRQGVWDGYFKWITNEVLLCSTGNSAQCFVAAWMGGEFGQEWKQVCVWLSPFAVHLRRSQHC